MQKYILQYRNYSREYRKLNYPLEDFKGETHSKDLKTLTIKVEGLKNNYSIEYLRKFLNVYSHLDFFVNMSLDVTLLMFLEYGVPLDVFLKLLVKFYEDFPYKDSLYILSALGLYGDPNSFEDKENSKKNKLNVMKFVNNYDSSSPLDWQLELAIGV